MLKTYYQKSRRNSESKQFPLLQITYLLYYLITYWGIFGRATLYVNCDFINTNRIKTYYSSYSTPIQCVKADITAVSAAKLHYLEVVTDRLKVSVGSSTVCLPSLSC